MTQPPSLERAIDDLLIGLRDDNGKLHPPGLLAQLRAGSRHPRQGDEDGGGRSGKPGSRPPGRTDVLSHVAELEGFVRRWDLHLRGHTSVTWTRPVEDALRAFPDLLRDVDETTYRVVLRGLRIYRSTAMTVLGFQEPKRTLRETPCFGCGARAVQYRPGENQAACGACGLDYDGPQVLLLLQERERLQAEEGAA